MILPSSLTYFLKLKLTAALIGFVCLLQVVYCDDTNRTNANKYFSSSVIGMVPLVETERQLLFAMGNYTSLWMKKISVIRSGIAEMRAVNLKSKNNPEEYLSNPINSYALIRRLHEDWVYWQLYLQNSIATDEINRVKELRENTPSARDFSDAVEGIYRLQMFAGLNAADMAVGILNGKQYNTRFAKGDCYTIGNELYSKNYFNLSSIWLNVTLELFPDGYLMNKAQIYELYARALLMQGRFTEALKAINNALDINPHHAKFLRTRSEIEFEIQTEIEADLEGEIAEREIPAGKYEESTHRSECLNADTSSYPNSKLSCIYNRTASPFLYIAPIKMEILNLDPYVVLYHDVIHDTEITSIKELSIPTMKRAQVYSTKKQAPDTSNGRVALLTSFEDETNDVTKRINQRISDMTGFDLTKSYPLQINNYGLGGNFEPHYDFHDTTNATIEDIIQRSHLSTVLVYMSDVEQGGATVFPRINVTVIPQKGSALVWYNLDIEGVGDQETMHTACPVIVGSKWVIIKMVTEYGQIFKRPHQKITKK